MITASHLSPALLDGISGTCPQATRRKAHSMWEAAGRIYSFPVTAHGEFRCRNDRLADWPRGMADPRPGCAARPLSQAGWLRQRNASTAAMTSSSSAATIAAPASVSLVVEWCTASMTPGAGPGAKRAETASDPGPVGAVTGTLASAAAWCSAPSGLISPKPTCGDQPALRVVPGRPRDGQVDQAGRQVRVDRLDQRHGRGQPGRRCEAVEHLISLAERPGHGERVGRRGDQDGLVSRVAHAVRRLGQPGQHDRGRAKDTGQAVRDGAHRRWRVPEGELGADHHRVPWLSRTRPRCPARRRPGTTPRTRR